MFENTKTTTTLTIRTKQLGQYVAIYCLSLPVDAANTFDLMKNM